MNGESLIAYSINFERLWKKLSENPRLSVEEIRHGNCKSNFIIRIPNGYLKVLVGNYGAFGCATGKTVYSNVTCVSRHLVDKPIYEIETKSGKVLRTTADHTCMRISTDEHGLPVGDGDGMFVMEQVSASDISVGDRLCECESEILFGEVWCDKSTEVTKVSVTENSVSDKSETHGTWVYDLEVESDRHVYFANGILVHNSQFINLSQVTKCKCAEDGIRTDVRFSDLPERTKEKVIKEAYGIVDRANKNVESLVNSECHTTHGSVMHYSLEYIASEGMYFKKKHYIVHKIISDDLPCNKFKYSGISVKKAEIPVAMKDFLKHIFESTMMKEWSEMDYRKEVENAYERFVSLDWNDISYFKKYGTPKRAISLTESEKGAGVHARAANFYNLLIEKLGIAGRYPKIGIGDEFRYSYILPTNEYGMDCIAFKNVFPDEFRSIFIPDYEKMFEKIFTKSLENYVRMMNYKTAKPVKNEEEPDFSIF